MLKKTLLSALPSPVAKLAYKIYSRNKFLGMTSKEEQQLYQKYTSKLINDQGAIVDLGCWMGSTSNSLAKGIKPLNSDTVERNQIYAYDQFIWDDWMDVYLPVVSRPYKKGDIFIDEAIDRTSAFKEIIQVEKVDLTDFLWNNGTIKILLVDAMKNEELTINIARSFFPSLKVGAILLHQDFKHYYTPWIHILQYNLRDHFNAIEDVALGGTTAFELTTEISESQAIQATTFDNIDDQFINNVFEYSSKITAHDAQHSLNSAKVMYYIHTSQRQKAISTLSDVLAGEKASGELKTVESSLT